MTYLISTKRLAFAITMGTLSLMMQAFVPGIPLGWGGGKLELADVPAIIGTVYTGPIGGIINGSLYGIVSTTYLALIPASVCSLVLLGYLSEKLKMRWKAIPAILIARVISAPILEAIFYQLIYYGPNFPLFPIWVISLYYCVPSAIISILLYIFLQKRLPFERLI